MEKANDTKGSPSWDGATDTFDIFEAECYQYRDTVESGKRYLCGPRIAQKLTGKAAVALLDRPQGWLNRKDGVETLLRFLRRKVFKAKIPDLGYHMDEFFFRLRRRRYESMTEYAMRARDKYVKMQKALARVVKQAKKKAEPEQQNRERQEDEENDEVLYWDAGVQETAAQEENGNSHQEATPKRESSNSYYPTSQSGSWKSWWHGGGWGNAGRSSSWSWSEASDRNAKEIIGELPDILPDVVLGWLLLQKIRAGRG